MSGKKLPTEKIANVAPFGLRMLTPLRRRVQEAAEANNRSMNAEIVARLEASFGEPVSQSEIASLIRELKETLDRVQAAEAILERKPRRSL